MYQHFNQAIKLVKSQRFTFQSQVKVVKFVEMQQLIVRQSLRNPQFVIKRHFKSKRKRMYVNGERRR